jgi:hypothetical protein
MIDAQVAHAAVDVILMIVRNADHADSTATSSLDMVVNAAEFMADLLAAAERCLSPTVAVQWKHGVCLLVAAARLTCLLNSLSMRSTSSSGGECCVCRGLARGGLTPDHHHIALGFSLEMKRGRLRSSLMTLLIVSCWSCAIWSAELLCTATVSCLSLDMVRWKSIPSGLRMSSPLC